MSEKQKTGIERVTTEVICAELSLRVSEILISESNKDHGKLLINFKAVTVDKKGFTDEISKRNTSSKVNASDCRINSITHYSHNELSDFMDRLVFEGEIRDLEEKTAEANAAAAAKELKNNSLIAENSMLKFKSKMVTQVAFVGIAVMAVTQILTVVVLG